MKSLPITVIVLTKDEELNLPHCLGSVAHFVDQIWVVDSHSSDRTLAVAKEFDAETVEHEFTNQAEQFNWAIRNLDIRNEWILRLDADEVMSEELWQEMEESLRTAPEEVSGFYLRRRVYFMGRWIKHGGFYPTVLLRLFRKGKAYSEEREMDEHIVLKEGEARTLKNDFKDDNHKDLSFWIAKHNNYSSREARAVLRNSRGLSANITGSQAEQRRWFKENVYGNLPLFVRPTLYFLYRYFIRLGFLDGKEGLIFHFLQGFWYRLLVDAKIYEIKKKNSHEQS